MSAELSEEYALRNAESPELAEDTIGSSNIDKNIDEQNDSDINEPDNYGQSDQESSNCSESRILDFVYSDPNNDDSDDAVDQDGVIDFDFLMNASIEEMMEMEREKLATQLNERKVKQESRYFQLTKQMDANKLKWKKLAETVDANEEDEFDAKLIKGRLKEIKSMCSYNTRPDYILYMLKEPVREFALSLMKYKKEEFKDMIRTEWKFQDVFQFHGRMAHQISLLANTHLRYCDWLEPSSVTVAGPQGRSDTESTASNQPRRRPKLKHTVNNAMRMNLITNPRYRTKSAIQQIVWFNRTAGGFMDMFPKEMETELARYLGYEIYDDTRIIRYQEQVPLKLYFVISGKLELYKVYSLSQGRMSKLFGTVGQRQITDLTEFESGKPSEFFLVAKGSVEVLSLFREDYLRLTSRMDADVIRDCLHRISIFQQLNITSQSLTNQNIKIRYFKNEKVITHSPNNDPHIFVLKSGTAIVARLQTVQERHLSRVPDRSSISRIGCRREKSHASAMIGINRRQKEFKKKTQTNSHSTAPMEVKALTTFKMTTTNFDRSGVTSAESQSRHSATSVQIEKGHTTLGFTRPCNLVDTEELSEITKTLIATDVQRRAEERSTYVKLDQLKTLDIFGLETLDEASSDSSSNLVLISQGAEVILINKRFLAEAMNNNTLLEMKKLVKTYVSENEAKSSISEDERWRSYKNAIMRRMVALHC